MSSTETAARSGSTRRHVLRGGAAAIAVGLSMLLALAMFAAACGGEDIPTLGATTDDPIEVEVSDRFRIQISEDPSLGDAWNFEEEEGDPEVIQLIDDDWETLADDPETVGAGGTRIFTFEAVGPGKTTIVLFNCFRCDDGVPPDEPPPGDIEIGGPFSYDIVVE